MLFLFLSCKEKEEFGGLERPVCPTITMEKNYTCDFVQDGDLQEIILNEERLINEANSQCGNNCVWSYFSNVYMDFRDGACFEGITFLYGCELKDATMEEHCQNHVRGTDILSYSDFDEDSFCQGCDPGDVACCREQQYANCIESHKENFPH